MDKSVARLWWKLGLFGDKTAIVSAEGKWTYAWLGNESARVNEALQGEFGFEPGQVVGILCTPGIHFVKALMGIWKAGGIALPLHTEHPTAQLSYFIKDSGATHLLFDLPSYEQAHALAAHAKLRLIRVDDKLPEYPQHKQAIPLEEEAAALMLYTSGTTSQPKGAVLSIRALHAQMQAMSQAWEWDPYDYVLNNLPLHHTHGLINILCTSLWNGATCELMPFSAALVWNRFLDQEVSVYMAVPTIYHKLLSYWEEAEEDDRAMMSQACEQMRLMVSGSAALPSALFEKWYAISGHRLLERYGMTEIGMALSNPYGGERREGLVGLPMPGVELRLMTEQGEVKEDYQPGIIEVKSPQLFTCYHGKPEATAKSFSADAWFITGDVAQKEKGYFRILGRESMDIIKCGGYKISALEIEAALLEQEEIDACAVIGLPDAVYGERIVAFLVLNGSIEIEKVQSHLEKQLPAYKIPREWKVLEALPRNAMGKVTKNELKRGI